MKRILDTVHGYIMVRDEFVRHIIDTTLFQRLRRIEQTSIRSVYPSARHDRFIHSLGVYHIGTLIVEHLKDEAKTYNYWGTNKTSMLVLFDSYLVACLLHDIAHAPFSHTFESYYGKKGDLSKFLTDLICNDDFTVDMYDTYREDGPNYHEYASAYVAYKEFGSSIKQLNLDAEFITRMITGVFYRNKKDTHQLHNCLISLLHGKVIDADRLDYACRDVWASGYSTSSIDLRRLISALHIKKLEQDYVVCFESNALNEIEGVLNVKDFQIRYVINHHTVNYEQWLMIQAAETMAQRLFPKEDGTLLPGDEALHNLINIDAIISKVPIVRYGVNVYSISDDDLIFLMKQDAENQFYPYWACRQYPHVPLWKSPDEFFHFFKVERQQDLKHSDFRKKVKECLERLEIPEDAILINEAEYKPRVKMSSLHLDVAHDVIRYTDIYPESKEMNINQQFYYVYIKKEYAFDNNGDNRRREIVKALRPVIVELYSKQEKVEG